MIKKILLIIVIAIVAGFIYIACQNSSAPELTVGEKACVNSGGTIETSLCCLSSGDFPDSCLIGACGCSPDNSHEVKVCNCGSDKCFDGTACVNF